MTEKIFTVYLGNSRTHTKGLIKWTGTFTEFCDLMRERSRVLPLTRSEYMQLSDNARKARKDIGGVVAADLRDGRRKESEVISRDFVTIDADNAPCDLPQIFKNLACKGLIYSTASSTPENPKYRVVIPLAFSITGEWKEIKEHLKALVNDLLEILGLVNFYGDNGELIKPVDYDASTITTQLMYFPTCCKGEIPIFEVYEGEYLTESRIAEILAPLRKEQPQEQQPPETDSRELNFDWIDENIPETQEVAGSLKDNKNMLDFSVLDLDGTTATATEEQPTKEYKKGERIAKLVKQEQREQQKNKKTEKYKLLSWNELTDCKYSPKVINPREGTLPQWVTIPRECIMSFLGEDTKSDRKAKRKILTHCVHMALHLHYEYVQAAYKDCNENLELYYNYCYGLLTGNIPFLQETKDDILKISNEMRDYILNILLTEYMDFKELYKIFDKFIPQEECQEFPEYSNPELKAFAATLTEDRGDEYKQGEHYTEDIERKLTEHEKAVKQKAAAVKARRQQRGRAKNDLSPELHLCKVAFNLSAGEHGETDENKNLTGLNLYFWKQKTLEMWKTNRVTSELTTYEEQERLFNAAVKSLTKKKYIKLLDNRLYMPVNGDDLLGINMWIKKNR